jgi:hypothetical protein
MTHCRCSKWIVLLFVSHLVGTAPAQAREVTVESLGKLLVKERHVDARFRETRYSALLTEPLKISGTLGFTPPARIEKHVTAPGDELFIADAGKIFIVNKTQDYTKTLAIDDYPALGAFVEAFRAMLGGQIENLQRYFDLVLSGRTEAWRLRARPRDPAMTQWVQWLEFSGHAGTITRIDIREANGDRSEMLIDEIRP